MDNNGEAFATVLVLAVDFYNVSIDERNYPTLRVGGANEGKPGVLILFEPKSLFEENWGESKVKNALRANASKSSHLIIDGTRVNDVRVYDDGIVPTVISRYGTGGGNVPMIFSHTQGLDVQASEENSPTLRTGGNGMAVAYDEFNDSISDIHHTLRAGTKQSTGVMKESTVRRLTPKECERLQGFPDDWTADQADSNRYKQCGNAVAVPVVEWIIKRMVCND